MLLRKRAGSDDALPGVAPGLAWLGVMLPYTPLQLLLFHEAAGRPAGTAWLDDAQPLVLVMTSANPGGEPLVTGNDEALARLAGIADALLVHDRDIVIALRRQRAARDPTRRPAPRSSFAARAATRRGRSRCRARGRRCSRWAPGFKNTVCVTRGDEAFLSPHVGDLDNAPTCGALEETVEHLVGMLDVRPAAVAHDLHPDFFSTRFAARLARASGRCRPSPCSTTTRTSRRCWPSTASTARCSGWRSTASVSAATARPGAASCCASTARAASGSGTCADCACPAATRGARAVAHGRRGAAPALGARRRIARRFADEPAAGVVARDARARVQRSRRPAASGAGSTPPPALLGVRAPDGLRGPGGDAARGARRGARPGGRRRRAVRHRDRTTSSTCCRWCCASPTPRPRASAAALFHATLAAALADGRTRAAARPALSHRRAAAAAAS